MIQPNNLPDQLTELLNSKGLLQQFRNNAKMHYDDTRNVDNSESLCEWIDYAFDWCSTPEGNDIWYELYQEAEEL